MQLILKVTATHAEIIELAAERIRQIHGSDFNVAVEMTTERLPLAQDRIAALNRLLETTVNTPGNKISLIKEYRNVTGLGLLESKNAIEEFTAKLPF